MRPSHIRASAAETALMIPAAFSFRKAYGHLKMPVVIVAGAEDRVVEAQQSAVTYGTSNRDGTAHVCDRHGGESKKDAVRAIGPAKRQKQTLGASVT